MMFKFDNDFIDNCLNLFNKSYLDMHLSHAAILISSNWDRGSSI
jgi:hypothetical protein